MDIMPLECTIKWHGTFIFPTVSSTIMEDERTCGVESTVAPFIGGQYSDVSFLVG